MRLPSSATHPNTQRALKQIASSGLVLLLIFSIFLPAAGATQNPAATIRLRIGVVKDGITVVGPNDLAGAGVDLAGVDPRTFALSSLGQPVAIYVEGESDGKFDAGDRLYFFGEKFRGPEMDQKYTDERVYWLDIGGTPGPRMAIAEGKPRFDHTPPADFATTLRAEQSMIMWTLYNLQLAQETQDTWFWSRLQLLSSTPVTATLPYTVPYPANAAATLRLEEISNAYVWDVNPDHRTKAALNGTPVLDATWDGLQVRAILSGSVPAGVLTHGVNTLDVGAWTLPGTSADDIYVNYWELDYRRQFRAWQDQLDFRAEAGGTQEYEIAGFSSPDIWIWDVTNSSIPVRLDVSIGQRLYLPFVQGGRTTASAPRSAVNDVSVRFRANPAIGSRYWLQTASTAQSPASVGKRLPTGLRNPPGGADAVIVASAALRPQAERLAQWHEAHGRRALVVDIQDAYDEFNEGIYHPKAVQAMMKWAATHWQAPAPAYLTLFGDGHWNFKNYNPAVYPGGPNHIPPYLAFEDLWQGEVPVDARYGDLNDDKLPEIAVGRIAVDTIDQAATVVDKITAYDENLRIDDWQRRAVFVADNADGAGDFPLVSDEIIAGYTPSDLAVTRVYLAGDPAATKTALLGAINAGAFMVQYAGHGAIDRWTGESILTTADITPATMTNGPRLPIVLTFNCLDGYFAYANPSRAGVAESMQRLARGGSIAAISPTGLGTTDMQHEFRKILLDVMFKDQVREIGSALTIAKQRFAATYGPHYLTQTMTLFGDPAMRLPGAAR